LADFCAWARVKSPNAGTSRSHSFVMTRPVYPRAWYSREYRRRD